MTEGLGSYIQLHVTCKTCNTIRFLPRYEPGSSVSVLAPSSRESSVSSPGPAPPLKSPSSLEHSSTRLPARRDHIIAWRRRNTHLPLWNWSTQRSLQLSQIKSLIGDIINVSKEQTWFIGFSLHAFFKAVIICSINRASPTTQVITLLWRFLS